MSIYSPPPSLPIPLLPISFTPSLSPLSPSPLCLPPLLPPPPLPIYIYIPPSPPSSPLCLPPSLPPSFPSAYLPPSFPSAYLPPSPLPTFTPSGGGFSFHSATDIFREFFGTDDPFADFFNDDFFGGKSASPSFAAYRTKCGREAGRFDHVSL